MSASAPSERGVKFAEWFRAELLKPDVRLASNWRAEWARCFDDLQRLDMRTDEMEIAMVCRWGRGLPVARGATVSKVSLFWRKNFLTPLKLRKRNDERVMYYDVFSEAMWDELGAGPALSGELSAAVESCHAAFCDAAKASVPVRLYGQQWRALIEGPEYDGDAAKLAGDVRHVVWFIARGIGQGTRNTGALKLASLLEPRRFFEERADARTHGRAFFQTGKRGAEALQGPRTQAALPAQAAEMTDEERTRAAQVRERLIRELDEAMQGGPR